MRQIPAQRFGQKTSRGHVGDQRQQKGKKYIELLSADYEFHTI